MKRRARLNYRRCRLTTRPAPGPVRAAGNRPLPRRAYFTFTMRRSGTTESTDAIFIPCSPPPARQRPAARRGVKGDSKKLLTAGGDSVGDSLLC
jgi:hypothetical protein